MLLLLLLLLLLPLLPLFLLLLFLCGLLRLGLLLNQAPRRQRSHRPGGPRALLLRLSRLRRQFGLRHLVLGSIAGRRHVDRLVGGYLAHHLQQVRPVALHARL